MKLITRNAFQWFATVEGVQVAINIASKQAVLMPFLVSSGFLILCRVGYWYAYNHSYPG